MEKEKLSLRTTDPVPTIVSFMVAKWSHNGKGEKKYSFEPDLNQRPMDVCQFSQLQSTALPTELSKVVKNLTELFRVLYLPRTQAVQV